MEKKKIEIRSRLRELWPITGVRIFMSKIVAHQKSKTDMQNCTLTNQKTFKPTHFLTNKLSNQHTLKPKNCQTKKLSNQQTFKQKRISNQQTFKPTNF